MEKKKIKEVQIGKRGYEPAIIEIAKVLRKRKKVLVRFNRNILKERKKQEMKRFYEMIRDKIRKDLKKPKIVGRTMLIEEVEK